MTGREKSMMSQLESFSERIIPTLFLLFAVGGGLLMVTSRRAGADPSNANCKPNRATCTANQQCCSGSCTAGVCATPTTTSTSTTTSTTTTSTTTTTLRFVDNGDGTVTDHQTGLQWEKKTGTVGTFVNCDLTSCIDPHDVNNAYMWSSSFAFAPDGGAFTIFLTTLNGGATGLGNCVSLDGHTITGGFNNHCDWRLPTIAELQTILLAPFPCGTNPCIDPIFGPVATNYWSSTTLADQPGYAFFAGFINGFITTDNKNTDSGLFVRAVRGGS